MARQSIERTYNPNELLRETEDLSVTSLRLPNAIHVRLDMLVNASGEGGMPVTRRDMAAALIAFAELEPDDLAAMVLRYRKSTAADLGLNGPDSQTES